MPSIERVYLPLSFFLSSRAKRRITPMRTNIINRTNTNVIGIRQDRIVKVGNDRCALAHARLLPAWHMHVAMAWQLVDTLKRAAKQAFAAATAAAGSSYPATRSRLVESVVVQLVPRASVRRG